MGSSSPAVFYSFSFALNKNWSTMTPPGNEIVQYLHGVCTQFQILDKIRLNTEVLQLRWLENEEEWEVTVAYLVPGTGDLSAQERKDKVAKEGENSVFLGKEIIRAKVAVSAAGGLVEPNTWPKDIPGMECFQGEVVHTARWKENIDLKGKDVVVVGSGCSAVQVVPQLVKSDINAKSVTQVMRSPPWVIPPIVPLDEVEEFNKNVQPYLAKVPGLMRLYRNIIFLGSEWSFFTSFAETFFSRKMRPGVEASFLDHMRQHAPEKYHAILTPNYQVGCKRRILDGGWLDSLKHPDIHLTTQPLKRVGAKSVILGKTPIYPPSENNLNADDGEVEIPADAIVLANGFVTNVWLHPLHVVGREKTSLHDLWKERGGPQAYLGIAVDKFPNFFIIYGPNTTTGHSSVIFTSENAANYCLKFIAPIIKGNVSTWEIKEKAEREWTEEVQTAIKQTTFHSTSCNSWYKAENGWNSMVYP
jgi:cation diffusion facilitator CzcD-associated flavoprotein CzcO